MGWISVDPREGHRKAGGQSGTVFIVSALCLGKPGAAADKDLLSTQLSGASSLNRGRGGGGEGGGGRGGAEPLSKAPLQNSSHELQEIAELKGQPSLLGLITLKARDSEPLASKPGSSPTVQPSASPWPRASASP